MNINRRQFLGATAAGLTTAMVGGVSSPARAQTEKDTISIAFAARSSNGLSPQNPSLNGADNWMVVQIFDRLVKHPDGGWATKPEEFQPSLAESWTSSPDAKVWTYKIRKGVKFHKDYGELTVEDVLFTFRRHLDPKINTLSKIFYRNIASIDSPDSSTIVITLKKPDPLFNGTCASHQSASILSKKAFEERGEGFNTNPIGTGPFQFESMDTASGLKLTAFADYFDGRAATTNLHVRYIADTTARTLAFASGDVDMIEGVRAPGWIATMRQQSSETIFDATAPGSLNTLNINLTKGPLAELKVRQAIRYAIDTAAIAAAFGETSTPMVGVIASQFPGSVKDADLPAELQYKNDPDKAVALLAEAGYASGLTIPCYISQREDYASIMLMIQEQLRAVGINLDMKIIDHATYHSDNRKDKNTLILRSVSYPPVPTQPFADQLLSSSDTKADGSGGENYSHYGTALPGIDALMEKVVAEPDLDKRLSLIRDMEKQVLKDLPCMGIVTLSYVVARNPRVDIGFKVIAGPAYWPLRHAKRAGA